MALTVSLLAVAAGAASLAGVSRVDVNDRRANQPRLVVDKCAQLREAPTAEPSTSKANGEVLMFAFAKAFFYELFFGTMASWLILGGICLGLWGCPHYHVWQQGLAGEAELRRTQQNRQIAIPLDHDA